MLAERLLPQAWFQTQQPGHFLACSAGASFGDRAAPGVTLPGELYQAWIISSRGMGVESGEAKSSPRFTGVTINYNSY